MDISHLLTRTCTLTRRGETGTADDYGNVKPDESTVDLRCELQQQQRTEPNAQGELSDTTWLLVLPAGTAVGTGDLVTVDGDGYELVGDPWPVRHPSTGAASHVECTLRRTA